MKQNKKSLKGPLDFFVTLIECIQSYFDTLLRYFLSVTFRGAAVYHSQIYDRKQLARHSFSDSLWGNKTQSTNKQLPRRVNRRPCYH